MNLDINLKNFPNSEPYLKVSKYVATQDAVKDEFLSDWNQKNHLLPNEYKVAISKLIDSGVIIITDDNSGKWFRSLRGNTFYAPRLVNGTFEILIDVSSARETHPIIFSCMVMEMLFYRQVYTADLGNKVAPILNAFFILLNKIASGGKKGLQPNYIASRVKYHVNNLTKMEDANIVIGELVNNLSKVYSDERESVRFFNSLVDHDTAEMALEKTFKTFIKMQKIFQIDLRYLFIYPDRFWSICMYTIAFGENNAVGKTILKTLSKDLK